ncbi:cytoskeleton-associated 5-like, partial [Paramuricea clavata]
AAADVVAGVVTKCLNARPKTKQKGIDIGMMYLEIEKQEAVQEEILKGLDNKQPKIVAGCVTFLRTAISEFGGKIFALKPVVKVLPKLFDHSDKNVREETKLLAIEIYKWIKDAVKAQLTNIKPVQMKELEEEWGKLDPSPPKPTRLTRTQQEKQAQAPQVDEAAGGSDAGIAEEESQVVDVDPYDLLDPVDILSKLPKDFYENMVRMN